MHSVTDGEHDDRRSASTEPHGEGLHPPRGPVIEQFEPRRRWTAGRVALQSAGFLACIALLVWAVTLAFAGENRDSVERLFEAPAGAVAGLLALTAFSVVINGLAFWVTLLPQQRLRIADVVATNAIAMLLAYLPFKISAMSRVLIHHRHDGVRFKSILAWFGSVVAIMIAVLCPIAGVTVLRPRLDAVWFVLAAAGVAVGVVGCLFAGRFAASRPRLDALTLGAGTMLRHTRAVLLHTGIRVMDAASLAGRFALAGVCLGQTMSPGESVLAGSIYFLSGLVAPFGMLGAREWAVGLLGLVPGGLSTEEFLVAALVVTGAEAATNAALGAIGFVWLRPDRLFRARGATGPTTRP